ncbi:MAG: GIY-YIG nuclease family protein [Archaeoglobaceae archaeon]
MTSYVLILRNDRRRKLRIGALGELEFEAGYYFYVGSLNGAHRIKRHFRSEKSKRWHVDYLEMERMAAILTKLEECRLAAKLSQLRSVPRFGCSDCSCESHLFYSPSLSAVKILWR